MEKSKKDYLDVFKKWCLDSSLDGLPSIARATSHILYLIFWITLFLGSVGLCAYMVAKSIIEYYQYDVITTDRLIAYNSIPFPIVSFCNENKFLSPEANVYIRDYFYKNFGATNISSFKDIANWFGSVDAASEEINWMMYELNDANLKDSVRKSLGYSAENTFYKLEFNNQPVNLSTDLEWFFDPSRGNCFRFNSGSNRFNSTRMGYGLYAEIFTGLPYEYTNYIYEPNSKGIHVEVKDPDNFPYVYKSVLLQSGKGSELILSKTKATILSEPYSKCENYDTYSTPVFDEMKRLSIDYDLTICLLALYQYKIVMKTGCYNQQLAPMFSNAYPPCQNRSLYPDFNNVNLTDSDLIQMCPLDCQRAFYQYTLGFDSFPSESWFKTALHYRRDYFERIFGRRDKLDYKAVKSSFASVYIDFENIAIEEINEKPSVELVNLFSNLGGTLGLFIGPSLLTILETFELVFGFFFVWLSHRALRKSIAKEDSNNSFQLKTIS